MTEPTPPTFSRPPPHGEVAPPPERQGEPAAAPLDEVVDDYEPKLAAVEWAVEQLYEDRSFEDVAAELSAGGWAADDAEQILEEARQRTRGHRGALTREQVALEADRMYRRSTGRWYVGVPMLSAAWKLLHSVATLLALRRRRRGPERKG